jgi:large subunit ribosomal protein L15
VEYAVINVDSLARRFDVGTEITPDLLRQHGLIHGRDLVKVLARGEISKALTVSAHKFSGRAADKIVAAGGRAEVVTV